MRIKENDVIVGLARHLAELNLGQYPAPYVENVNKPAVTFGALPTNTPTAVALFFYMYDTGRDAYNPDVYVQLRFRCGTPYSVTGVNTLAQNVFDVLDWADDRDPELWPGGLRVMHACRVVAGQPVPDGNNRYERADSYRLTINPGG